MKHSRRSLRVLLVYRYGEKHYDCHFEDWGKLIGDVPAATAILDRFLQDAELIQITGKSYRLRGRAADTSPGQNAAEPAKPGSARPATEESRTGQTRAPGRPKTSTNTTGR
jgi:hypothetical protein